MTSIATNRRKSRSGAAARPRGETRKRVRALLEQGLSNGEIARRLNVTPTTVSYHARKLGVPPSKKYAPRDDWLAVQRYYDEGHTLSECEYRFGFSRRSWQKAILRGQIVPRPRGLPVEELLVADRTRNRKHVKLRLLSSGLKDNRCEECGIEDWLGRPLSMALHHANGDGRDNRSENLVFLCPNCHSQTPNYARRHRIA